MDVIIVGLYNESDKFLIKELMSNSADLEIEWDYAQYNIESIKGVKLLEEKFGLYCTGVLVEKGWKETFTSYPLIYQVTEALESDNSEYPKLFLFLEKLNSLGINKMIIGFADEWDQNTLVRFEKLDYSALINRLNKYYVWCEGYLNLISDTEMRDNSHPLILEVYGHTR